MEQHQIIRRDPVVMTPLMEEEDDACNPYLPQGRSGKWRNFRFRLGSLHFSYTSVHIDPPRVRPEARAGAADAMHRYLPVRRPAKPHFYNRFIDHLGITASVMIFLSGAVFVAAMQSNAIVVRNSDARAGRSLETGIVNPTIFPITNARDTVSKRPNVEDSNDPMADIPMEQLTETSVNETEPVVQTAIQAPRPAKVAQPQTAAHGDHRSPAPKSDSTNLSSGPLERIPVISSAIERALDSGELQSWQLGTAEGIVVVGDPVDVSGQQCRVGSILARQMGEQARTQAFRRCRPT